MIRFLNLALIAMLVASAVVVYSIKYESTLQAEKVAKLMRSIEKEKVQIAALRSEWATLAQPERLEALSKKFLQLQSMKVDQLVEASRLPVKPAPRDLIGEKLQGLGIPADPLATGSIR